MILILHMLRIRFCVFLPVWYMGISSPSASSRIKVPETGDVLSSSKVRRRDTRFLAAAVADRLSVTFINTKKQCQ